jgi:hypothetical protein
VKEIAMRYLLAIIYGFMNLAGCTDAQNRSMVVMSEENGQVTLDSRTDVRLGKAWFQCDGSRSGRCYYTVFDADARVAAFSLAVAESLRMSQLPPGFTQCVSTSADEPSTKCKPR